MSLTVIGDVHGKYAAYYKLTERYPTTLQLGDMGFKYDYHEQFIDCKQHKFFAGNHDNYALYPQCPHGIGDFGTYAHGGAEFFFIRGGLSIDLKYRHLGISWWAEEELCYSQAVECVRQYTQAKPEIVISHECPVSAVPYVSTWSDKQIMEHFDVKLPSFTAKLLEELFSTHQPKLWIHGHFHAARQYKIGCTEFVSLPELGTYNV